MRPNDLASFILSAHARGAVEFTLYHIGFGGKLDPVRSFTFDGEPIFAQQLAEEVIALAEDDASVTGGTQAYGLWGSRDGVNVGGCSKWRVHGKIEAQPGGGELAPTEPASAAGAVGMTMRHLEARERLAVLATEHAMNHSMRLLKLESEKNAELQKENRKHASRALEVYSQIEELLSTRHARELEASREARDRDAQQKMLAHLEPAISLVVTRMLGMPAVPLEATPTVDSFLQSITPEQFDVIARTLSPEQLIALQGIYRERSEAAKKREQKASGGAEEVPS